MNAIYCSGYFQILPGVHPKPLGIEGTDPHGMNFRMGNRWTKFPPKLYLEGLQEYYTQDN